MKEALNEIESVMKKYDGILKVKVEVIKIIIFYAAKSNWQSIIGLNRRN